MLRSLGRAGIVVVSLFAALLWPPVRASGQLYSVQTFPVGHMPQGLAVGYATDGRTLYLAVANAGDNTVSILQGGQGGSLVPLSKQVVASPYNVVTCGPNSFLVTSSASTVTVINVGGAAPTTVNVGPQPYSATCSGGYFASTYGDSAFSMIDFSSGTVTLRVPNVPGTQSPSGIYVYGGSGPTSSTWLAFVAGTEANVVTVVNLMLGKVVATFPVSQPIAMVGTTAVSANGSVTFINPNTLTVSGTGLASAASPISAIAFNGGGDSLALSSGSAVNTVFQSTNPPGLQQPQPGAAIQASFAVPGVSGAGEVVPYCAFGEPLCGGYFITLPDADSVALVTVLTGPSSAAHLANAASFEYWAPSATHPLSGGPAPGMLATAFTPPTSLAPQWATTLPLPTSLGGVSVAVGGTATYASSSSTWSYSAAGSVLAPLLYLGSAQINFQMPPGIQGELVPIQITYPGGATLLSSVSTGATDPGIFTLTSVPTGPAAVLNQDNSVNLGGNPAARGSVIQIFATGAGATNPSLAAGVPAPASGSPLIYTQAQPTVTIGGVNAAVQFSGLAPGFVGVWQINAVVPPSVTPGSTVSLSVTAGGIQSNTVTIAVK